MVIGMQRAQRSFGTGRRVAGFRAFGVIGLTGGIGGLVSDMIAAALAIGVAGYGASRGWLLFLKQLRATSIPTSFADGKAGGLHMGCGSLPLSVQHGSTAE
ncbi:hypothetical protein PX699_28800 [Sphingobium sp. H39-3-25]|uniref:hypothetical protein n=1 Tax=Sphingobium arseniciresistens TaxID=3030834 RepID=UPI0023B8BC2A|nr:hypothetical protein [Sphingobium arseniciresistens]